MCLATVVIPTYNRPEHLRGVLAALADQADQAAPFRVVVVDDGSTPPAELPRENLPFAARLVRLPENRGRAAARNAGIDAVDTPLVVFLDDDMRPQEGFVRAYVESVDPRGRRIGLGHVTFHPDVPRERLTTYLETRGIAKLRDDEPIPFKYFLTYNSAAPTELLRKCGGFDPRIRHWGGEDIELAWRLTCLGATFVRVPEAWALHAHRRSLREVWDVSVRFAEESMPVLLSSHPELVPELRADRLGPARYAAGMSWRRWAARTLTHRPLPQVARLLLETWPMLPWPMRLIDYVLASAWREGLDRSARGRRKGDR